MFLISDNVNGIIEDWGTFETVETARERINDEIDAHVENDTQYLIECASEETRYSHGPDEYIDRVANGEDPEKVARERGEAFFHIHDADTEEVVE